MIWLLKEIKEKLRSQQSDPLNKVSGRMTELGNSFRSNLAAGNRGTGFFGNALANCIIIVSFAAFMFTVRYVIQSISDSKNWLQSKSI